MNERSAKKYDVCVLGLGYIGLPTAAFLAAGGMDVLGVDINPKHVEKINNSEVPFHEPGFEKLLVDVTKSEALRAAIEPEVSDAYIVAVPTPFLPDHSVDVSYIDAAAASIAPTLRPGALVVLESTSPPGTTKFMSETLRRLRPDLSTTPGDRNGFFVAHCPERVLPGQIMEEMATNDRVVGGINPESTEKAAELYGRFCRGEILKTDAATAEMAKLTENSFRDVNIAFANELSIICDKLGIDVWELIDIANHHPRVNILQPGPGVGGHCIAVDPWFIVSSAPEQSRLIRTAREVNDSKPDYVLNKVLEKIGPNREPRIAALGLAFKANIDDLRESPAVAIIERLAASLPASDIRVVEPNVDQLPASLRGQNNVDLVGLETAFEKADVILLLVDHDEFKDMDVRGLDLTSIIDTRGILKQRGSENG